MYKLINEKANYFMDDLLETVCKNRGVDDVNFIKNPTDKYNGHYSQLVNMDKALKVFDAFIQTGEVIDVGTIPDSDMDGISSSAMLTLYLEKNFPNVKMHFLHHSGKGHGINKEIMTQIDELDNLDILFVPDAGSSDFEQHKLLYERGIPVITIDHHETSHLSEHAIVVNNQTSPDYVNKQLSGAGMVFRFLECLDNHYGLDDAKNYTDLLMAGLVGDSMLITQKENTYLVEQGKQNIQNVLLKELIFKTIGKWEKVYPQTLSFGLVPKINAVIRVGTLDERKDLFNAMIGRTELTVNSRTKKEEELHQKATRQAINCHSRQNTSKKKWLKAIKERIQEENLNSRPILVITFNKKDKFANNLGGVIASSLTNIYRKPVIMLTHNEEKKRYGGSMRGYDGFTDDLKSFLEELNIFDWIQGHANAAGVQISEENLATFGKMQDKMIEQFALEGNSAENEIKVDFIISAKNMRGSIVDEVQKYEKYWCKGLEAPLFALTDLVADMNDIKISSGGMLKIPINGVDYTQFTATQEWIDLAETNQTVTFDAIGKLSVSDFMGKTSRQCIMDSYVIKNVEESTKRKVLFEF